MNHYAVCALTSVLLACSGCGAPDRGALAPRLEFASGLRPADGAGAQIRLDVYGPDSTTVVVPWDRHEARIDRLQPGDYEIDARLSGGGPDARPFHGSVQTRVEAGRTTTVRVPMAPETVTGK